MALGGWLGGEQLAGAEEAALHRGGWRWGVFEAAFGRGESLLDGAVQALVVPPEGLEEVAGLEIEIDLIAGFVEPVGGDDQQGRHELGQGGAAVVAVFDELVVEVLVGEQGDARIAPWGPGGGGQLDLVFEGGLARFEGAPAAAEGFAIAGQGTGGAFVDPLAEDMAVVGGQEDDALGAGGAL